MRIIGNILNVIFGFIEIILGLRLIFKLLGVSATSPLINWLYNASGMFVEPFNGIIPNLTFGSRFVLELTTVLALVIFAVIATILNNVFNR